MTSSTPETCLATQSNYLEEAMLMCVEADVNDSVQKVHHLKLRTEFRYTGAGEYLIFGGVPPKVGLPLHLQSYLTITRP